MDEPLALLIVRLMHPCDIISSPIIQCLRSGCFIRFFLQLSLSATALGNYLVRSSQTICHTTNVPFPRLRLRHKFLTYAHIVAQIAPACIAAATRQDATQTYADNLDHSEYVQQHFPFSGTCASQRLHPWASCRSHIFIVPRCYPAIDRRRDVVQGESV